MIWKHILENYIVTGVLLNGSDGGVSVCGGVFVVLDDILYVFDVMWLCGLWVVGGGVE